MSHVDRADRDPREIIVVPHADVALSHQPPVPARLLPATVTTFAVRFETDDYVAGEQRFLDVPLPAGLCAAAPRRRLHYRAGRFCAVHALQGLGVAGAVALAWQGTNLPPAWPDGVTGSITHTDGFACAAVAWSRHVKAIGVDSERMASSARAGAVSPLVCVEEEIHRGLSAGLDRPAAVTLAFSIKEAVFKCLYPFVGRYFGYLDVSLDGLDATIDGAGGTFCVTVTRALGRQIPGRMAVTGSFGIDGDLVHAAVCLQARRGSA